jgi:hypothetical protein
MTHEAFLAHVLGSPTGSGSTASRRTRASRIALEASPNGMRSCGSLASTACAASATSSRASVIFSASQYGSAFVRAAAIFSLSLVTSAPEPSSPIEGQRRSAEIAAARNWVEYNGLPTPSCWRRHARGQAHTDSLRLLRWLWTLRFRPTRAPPQRYPDDKDHDRDRHGERRVRDQRKERNPDDQDGQQRQPDNGSRGEGAHGFGRRRLAIRSYVPVTIHA